MFTVPLVSSLGLLPNLSIPCPSPKGGLDQGFPPALA